MSILFIILFVVGKRYIGGAIAYDLQHYLINYNTQSNMNEKGFQLIRDIFIEFGFPFESFYIFITTVALIIIFRQVYKNEANASLFCVAYLTYYILIPIDQLKNFCAFSFLLISIPYLIKHDKKGIIKFSICILIASTFHPSYLLYFVLLLICMNNKEWLIKTLAFILVVLSIAIVSLNRQEYIARLLSTFLSGFNTYNRYDKYFLTTSNLAPLAIISVYIVTLLLIKKQKKRAILLRNPEAIVFSGLYDIILISSVFIPILFMSMTLYRLIRDISLIAILYLCKKNGNTGIKQRCLILIYILAISVGLFLYDIVIKGYWSDFRQYYFIHDFFI